MGGAGKQSRKVRGVTRKQKDGSTDFNRSIVREEVLAAMQELHVADTINGINKFVSDTHELVGGIGVVLWDIRTSVAIAYSDGGSAKERLDGLIENLHSSLSTLEELMDKEAYRHIMADRSQIMTVENILRAAREAEDLNLDDTAAVAAELAMEERAPVRRRRRE